MRKIYPIINNKEIKSDISFKVFNPYNNEEIAEVFLPSTEETEMAVSSNLHAFETTRKRSVHERKAILQNIVRIMKERTDELAEIITLESGKPIKYAKGEIARTITTFELGIEECGRINGEYIDLDITPASSGRTAIIKRFPLGPLLAITPFNFPMNLVAHKLSPAIACGTPFILKPASTTPISAYELCKIAIEAGCVEGEIQFLPLRGHEMEKLVKDERIKKISFTGSEEIGWSLKRDCGTKKISLELGGNAGVIIEDTDNLEKAADRIIMGSFAYSGQVCISVQRIYINNKYKKELTKLLVKKAENLKIGNPMNSETEIGPMITEKEQKRVIELIEEAVKSGGKLLTGGTLKNNILKPTLLTDIDENHPLNSEEIFGPVAIIHYYDRFEDAVKKVNDSRFGLQAGVFTDNIKKAMYAYNEIIAGGIIINDVPTFRSDNMPYGGSKNSGTGREGVKYAIEDMTERRIMVFTN